MNVLICIDIKLHPHYACFREASVANARCLANLASRAEGKRAAGGGAGVGDREGSLLKRSSGSLTDPEALTHLARRQVSDNGREGVGEGVSLPPLIGDVHLESFILLSLTALPLCVRELGDINE
ncbi:hypothetical protein E2C01_052738 [Portunus trituberculatus]|uniref:Uncharacterized protein n=1 Tax=Portunus trituberculatus TaxID=210409 RepID=A0A5B7GMA2_PORTR|nr:hypothetical protein [Portunus trituberculatus]